MEAGIVREAAPLAARVTDVVRAAGGVVWRMKSGGAEVLLVHRPKYDDWSFPKGKAETGEDDLTCALREVEEETGLRCAVGRELATTRYVDHHGRDKVVRYWAMEPATGTFVPNAEVDEARWLSPATAASMLTNAADRDVLASFTADA